MDAMTFVSLFTQAGFPTAMCAVLFWILWQDKKNHREQRKEEKQSNDEIVKSLQSTIEKNTDAIAKLENLMMKVLIRVEDVQDSLEDNTKGRR